MHFSILLCNLYVVYVSIFDHSKTTANFFKLNLKTKNKTCYLAVLPIAFVNFRMLKNVFSINGYANNLICNKNIVEKL